MGAFVAKTPEQSEAEEQRLPAKPGHSEHPFYIQLHPSEWDWEPGSGWVPSIGQLAITPGVMGVSAPVRKGGAIEDGPAILAAQKLGWVILHETKDYLRYGLTVNGRRCYFTKWDTPDIFNGRVTWTCDRAGFLAYIMSKVGSHPGALVKPCSEGYKTRKIAAFVKRLDRLETDSANNPQHHGKRRRYLEAVRKHAAMVAELAGEDFKAIEAKPLSEFENRGAPVETPEKTRKPRKAKAEEESNG